MTPLSSLEDEVWGQEMAYWEYLKAGDWASYLALWHEEVIGWPNNELAPLNKGGIHKLVAGMLAAPDFVSMTVELRRMSVHVIGNVGIAYYEADRRAAMKTGTEICIRDRVTHTWQNTGNGWKIIGGMSAPLTHP